MSDPKTQHENDDSVAATACEEEASAVDHEAQPADLAGFRRRSRYFLLGSLLIVAGIIGGVGAFIKTDYVALSPGVARDTEPLISIEGTDAYPSDGELLFTTVKLRQKPNIWEYLWKSLDDDVEFVPEELILGDRTKDENREINLKAMVDSKSIAIAVALEELGYDAIRPAGVFVAQVVEDTAADGVINPGDIIRKVGEEPILMSTELVELLKEKDPGDSVELTIETPEGALEVRTLVLGAKEDDASAAFLGVAPQTLVDFTDLDVGFEVEIDSGRVGGPSAGLAFTLGVLDELTPGELTGGTKVAVTGTMSVDGTVGPVGGVPQKAAAVRDSGIEYFIVPRALGEEDLAELRDVVDGKVQIVPVDDLEEALEFLDGLGGDVGALSEYAASLEVVSG